MADLRSAEPELSMPCKFEPDTDESPEERPCSSKFFNLLKQYENTSNPHSAQQIHSPNATLSQSNSRRKRKTDDESLDVYEQLSGDAAGSKASSGERKRELRSASTSPRKSPKKEVVKRGYAPPETYAHLKELSDYIEPGLDSKSFP